MMKQLLNNGKLYWRMIENLNLNALYGNLKQNFLNANIGVLLFYFALTAYFTYPLINNIGTHLHFYGDPELIAWLIWHVQEKVLSFDFINLYETNSFFPFKSNLAYSHICFTLGIVALPLRFFTNDPVSIYNCMVFGAYWLTTYSVFKLAKFYTKNVYASIIAGVICGFSPFMMAQFGHLQITSCYFLPLIIIHVEKFFLNNDRKSMYIFTFLLIIQIWLDIYNFVFITLFITGLSFFRIKKIRKEFLSLYIRSLIISGTLFIFFTSIVFYKYYQLTINYSFTRSLIETLQGSADLSDYLKSGNNFLWSRFLLQTYQIEHMLFSGGIALLLLIIGMTLLLFNKINFLKRELYIYYILLAVLFILSLGPILQISEKQLFFDGSFPIVLPYSFLYKIFPLLKGIRVPARANSIIMIIMAVNTAIILHFLLQNLKENRQKIIYMLIVLCLIIELKGNGIGMIDYKIKSNKNLWIKNNTSLNSLVWEIENNGNLNWQVEGGAVLSTTIHNRTTLNGYSGFFPPEFYRLRKDFIEQDPEEILDVLKAMADNTYMVWNKPHSNMLFDKYIKFLKVEYEDSLVTILSIPKVAVPTKIETLQPLIQYFTGQINVYYLNNSNQNKFFGEEFDKIEIYFKDGSKQVLSIPKPIYLLKSSNQLKEISFKDKSSEVKNINLNGKELIIQNSEIINFPKVNLYSSFADTIVSQPGIYINFNLNLKNLTGQTLSSHGFNPINIATEWYNENSDRVLSLEKRYPMPVVLANDSIYKNNIKILAPLSKGNYKVKFTVVQEYVKWFYTEQPTSIMERIVVVR